MSASQSGTPTRTGWHKLRHLGWRALRMEIGVWRSLYRLLFFRPRVPRGARGFSYDKPIRGILIAFIVVSAIEIPIIDLLVHQIVWLRIPLLIAGIWGLTWMLGLLFGYLTRPHAVGPNGIRVRYGDEVDIEISWDALDAVALRKRHVESSKTFTFDGSILNISVQNETQIDIRLYEPIDVRLPGGPATVSEIRIATDDPEAFLAAVREFIRPVSYNEVK